jgi:hypothetical protein
MYDTFVTDDGEFPHHWLCRGKTSTVLVIHVCVMPEKNLERRQSTSYCSLRGEMVFTPIGCLTLGTGEQAANYLTMSSELTTKRNLAGRYFGCPGLHQSFGTSGVTALFLDAIRGTAHDPSSHRKEGRNLLRQIAQRAMSPALTWTWEKAWAGGRS